MALRAQANLQHYREAEAPPETERVFVPAGEEVPEGLFDEAQLEELKLQGVVVDDGDLKKEEDLQKQVQELQAKLEAQRIELESARARQPSPGTLYQTQAITEDTVEEDQEQGDPPPGNAKPAVVGDAALASAGSSKVAQGGEVKSPNQSRAQQQSSK
jgi:hypothetical protein